MGFLGKLSSILFLLIASGCNPEGSSIDKNYKPGQRDFSETSFEMNVSCSDPASYLLSDSSSVEVTQGQCRLKQIEYKDDLSNAFASSIFTGTLWNPHSQSVILNTDTNTASFDSSWTPQWQSIIAYWDFNGSGSISTGTTIPAVIGGQGTASNTNGTGLSFTDAKIGKGLKCDGVDDLISLPGGILSNLSEFSVSFWVKADNSTAAYRPFEIDGPNSPLLYVALNHTANVLRIAVKTSGADVTLSTSEYSLTNWNHVVVTAKNPGSLYAYVNGKAIAPAAISSAYANGGTGLNRFCQNRTGNYKLPGIIDEVAFWNKQLTDAESKLIYSRQKSRYAGVLTSKIFEAPTAQHWSLLAPITALPFLKEISAESGSETSDAYPKIIGSTSTIGDNDNFDDVTVHWKFNEAANSTTAHDSVSNITGTIHTGVTTGEKGNFNQAVSFNGTNGYVSAAANQIFGLLSGSSSTTFSAWIYYSRLNGASASANTIFSGALASGLAFATLNIRSDSGHEDYLRVTGRSNTSDSLQSGDSSIPLEKDSWNHVAAVYDYAADRITVFVNGVGSSTNVNFLSNTLSSTLANTTLDTIGSHFNLVNFYKGSVDEFAIWKRGLSAEEVKQIYRRGSNRIKYQLRSCASSTCAAEELQLGSGKGWKGPDNSFLSYFSELNNNTNPSSSNGSVRQGPFNITLNDYTGLSSALNPQRWFQYRAILESQERSASTLCNYGSTNTRCSPELNSIQISPSSYSSSTPYIVTKTNVGQSYSKLEPDSFIEVLSGNCTSGVRYALSPNGSDFFFWDGSDWVPSTNQTQINSAAEINPHLKKFSDKTGSGILHVKIYLRSDGTNPCALDSLTIKGSRPF